MKVETAKGALVDLVIENSNVYAYHNGKLLGAVSAQASAELGWHLRAGDVAVAVAGKHVADVKMMLADAAIASAEKSMTSEQKAKEAEIREYWNSRPAIENASYGSE